MSGKFVLPDESTAIDWDKARAFWPRDYQSGFTDAVTYGVDMHRRIAQQMAAKIDQQIPQPLRAVLAFMCGGKPEDIVSIAKDDYLRDVVLVTSKTGQTKLRVEQIRRVLETQFPSLSISVLPEKETKVPYDILVLAGSLAEARYFAELMGWAKEQWTYLSDVNSARGVRNKSVYIYGTARERTDFNTLFNSLAYHDHTFTDMME